MILGSHMATQNLRRQPRGSTNETIRVSWQDPARGLVYLRGKCLDASKNGMKIRLNIPIPRQSVISILADGMGFAGNASVRHVTRGGSYYALGLELSHPIPQVWLDKMLDKMLDKVPDKSHESSS